MVIIICYDLPPLQVSELMAHHMDVTKRERRETETHTERQREKDRETDKETDKERHGERKFSGGTIKASHPGILIIILLHC